jgi:hypothetical protein
MVKYGMRDPEEKNIIFSKTTQKKQKQVRQKKMGKISSTGQPAKAAPTHTFKTETTNSSTPPGSTAPDLATNFGPTDSQNQHKTKIKSYWQLQSRRVPDWTTNQT